MKKIIAVILFGSVFVACQQNLEEKPSETKGNTTDSVEISKANVEQETVDTIDFEKPIQDSLSLDNGIEIRWLEHGNGEQITENDVVRIDYKVRLEDSTVVDGNHLLKKSSMLFMVGFQMQTKGWDIALKNLRVGDFAHIKIPAKLARGEKGIKGLIPPNADNYLSIRILNKEKPTREIDGNKVWVFEESKKIDTKFDETNTISFHAMISSKSKPLYFNSYRENMPFELKLEDYGTIPGLKKALINAKKGDRMFVWVPASEGYGNKGYQDVVKPNESLFYNIFVMHVMQK